MCNSELLMLSRGGFGNTCNHFLCTIYLTFGFMGCPHVQPLYSTLLDHLNWFSKSSIAILIVDDLLNYRYTSVHTSKPQINENIGYYPFYNILFLTCLGSSIYKHIIYVSIYMPNGFCSFISSTHAYSQINYK